MTIASTDKLIESLTQRALDGDIEAAKLVLSQPRRISIKALDDDGGFDARSAYLMVWDALIAGRVNVLEASQWLDVLQRVERYL
jgi:hypothetical protein